MKYKLFLDEGNYLTFPFFLHTNTIEDTFELNPNELIKNRLNCYYLSNNKLVLDVEKYNELNKQEEDKKEILDLKAKLYESDYLVSRTFEEVMALSNPITFVSDTIKILVAYNKKYKDTIANRKAWRKRIEELEKGA